MRRNQVPPPPLPLQRLENKSLARRSLPPLSPLVPYTKLVPQTTHNRATAVRRERSIVIGISKIVAAFALASALVLDQASNAIACMRAAVYYTPCEYVQEVAVPTPTTVLRAVVLSK